MNEFLLPVCVVLLDIAVFVPIYSHIYFGKISFGNFGVIKKINNFSIGKIVLYVFIFTSFVPVGVVTS